MAPSSSFTKWSSIIAIAVAIFLLDWFYMLYITSHGFDLKAENFSVAGSSFPVQLQWLPVVGVVIVAFVALYEVSARIFPRRGIEIDPLGRLRLLRAVAFSLALFVCVLYVPYLIGSNWFWARLSELSRSVSQVQSFGLSLLSTDESVMALSPLWQYSLSQTLAPAAMVLSAWAFGRSGRRPRKQR